MIGFQFMVSEINVRDGVLYSAQAITRECKCKYEQTKHEVNDISIHLLPSATFRQGTHKE